MSQGFRPAARLASAWCAVRRLSESCSWVWLVGWRWPAARSGAFTATPFLSLVLFDGMPKLVDAVGAAGGIHE